MWCAYAEVYWVQATAPLDNTDGGNYADGTWIVVADTDVRTITVDTVVQWPNDVTSLAVVSYATMATTSTSEAPSAWRRLRNASFETGWKQSKMVRAPLRPLSPGPTTQPRRASGRVNHRLGVQPDHSPNPQRR